MLYERYTETQGAVRDVHNFLIFSATKQVCAREATERLCSDIPMQQYCTTETPCARRNAAGTPRTRSPWDIARELRRAARAVSRAP